ncbi:MAG: UDP-N-acetylmuramoyl-L-alanyl-D-glutamate--2,6-diaminopimelate ligase, partial [Chloroflexota bacterium]|nr:UDP-N-acetylmuramoyl-L-alanyl-D-glutamate--2,6-diaminopimelate ligase [Chloroflexota bacterium]
MTERGIGLGALADAVAPERVIGVPAGEITGLTAHSAEVEPGSVFFAIPGGTHDGWTFVTEAASRGAVAVVAERETAGLVIPQLIVANARHAVADAADAWYGRPSAHLRVYGITGTDGKSTTAFLSVGILLAAGRRPGLVGTVDTRVGDQQMASTSRTTTPEALELQRLLADMVEAGNDSVVIEATSHGLAQARVRNCRFAVGVVTTITSEHLEFHRTLDAYRAAKAILVEEAPVAVLNRDDDTFEYLQDRAAGAVISYGIDAEADIRATALDLGPHGSRFHVTGSRWSGPVTIQLPGRFNVSNPLAALGLAQAEDIDLEQAAAALAEVRGVPGRMERIDLGQPFGVIVDYAHTADSLAKMLRTLRPLTTGR